MKRVGASAVLRNNKRKIFEKISMFSFSDFAYEETQARHRTMSCCERKIPGKKKKKMSIKSSLPVKKFGAKDPLRLLAIFFWKSPIIHTVKVLVEEPDRFNS